MKFIAKFILVFLIFSLTFFRESAALESGDDATPLFVQAFDISSQDTAPRGLTFNDDGSKMYTTGTAGQEINQYNLSTNFDVSTASFVHKFSTSSTETVPMSVKFNNDGTKMFIVGSGGDEVNEYILTTAFDISTASHESIFSLSGYDTVPWGIDFNNDGTKMFITGNQGDDINEFSLSTAFLPTTASFVRSLDVSSQSTSPLGLAFNSDGTSIEISRKF